jgi:hypothetical protein
MNKNRKNLRFADVYRVLDLELVRLVMPLRGPAGIRTAILRRCDEYNTTVRHNDAFDG